MRWRVCAQLPTEEKLLIGYYELVIADILKNTAAIPEVDQYTLHERLQLLVDCVLEAMLGDREFVEITKTIVGKSPLLMMREGMPGQMVLKQLVATLLEEAEQRGEIAQCDFKEMIAGFFADYLFSVIVYWLKDDSEEFANATQLGELTLAVLVLALNRAQAHKVFRSEFGHAPEQVFATFESQAFAAASLGQVHRATLDDGRAVAVMVQYPGIGTSIKSDLAMLRGMMQTLGWAAVHLPRKEVADQVMTEVASKLEEELDYEHEASQLEWFHQHVPAVHYVIPLPVRSQSSRRVLTMERLDGLHLDVWLATNPDQASRNHFGQLLFDWFSFSLYELGRLTNTSRRHRRRFIARAKLSQTYLDPAFP